MLECDKGYKHSRPLCVVLAACGVVLYLLLHILLELLDLSDALLVDVAQADQGVVVQLVDVYLLTRTSKQARIGGLLKRELIAL